jgi:hypothetical protein
VPADKLKQSLDRYRWAEPATYAIHLGPAPSLFQYGTHNEYVRLAAAKRYFKMSSRQKEAKFDNSDHVLNAEARRDRFEFLREHLGLSKLGARNVGESSVN